MTIAILQNTYVAAGYALAAGVTQLNILATATVGGTGVSATAQATVDSYGNIYGSGAHTGVTLAAGGNVRNGATGVIRSAAGVSINGGQGYALNLDSIVATKFDGVDLLAGGKVINGSYADHTASISAVDEAIATKGAPATVTNYGVLTSNQFAVYAFAGGSITNGSQHDSAARITGELVGIEAGAAASVANFGTVEGVNATAIYLTGGGTVTNGADTDAKALIEGGTYGLVDKQTGTLNNFGSVAGESGAGALLAQGGAITNGSLVDPAARISGYDGVIIGGVAAAVVNFGAIDGEGQVGQGVLLSAAGGAVINGAASDRSALIFGATGVELTQSGSVTNFGVIEGPSTAAVFLVKGGGLTNGAPAAAQALIDGAQGVFAEGVCLVANYGTINGSQGDGVDLVQGGTVNNGSNADSKASILSPDYGVIIDAAATVHNFGTVQGAADGVYLQKGGTATNGSLTDLAALIGGGSGVASEGAAASLANFGAIEGAGQGGFGAHLFAGGDVTNGAANDRTALIFGATGVDLTLGGTVANFGTIEGPSYRAVRLEAGGTVTNGAAGDTQALIDGSVGIDAVMLATVTNFGAITAAYGDGVGLAGGGAVTNGSAVDGKASIQGSTAVEVSGAPGMIVNLGAIHGVGTSEGYAGVYLHAGGSLTNGVAAATSALIDGYAGVIATGSATIANFGVIHGLGAGPQAGIELLAGGAVTNGSAKDSTAAVSGYVGLTASGPATVTNFATIAGAGGVALRFLTPGGALVVEAGSTFQGQVLGDTGALVLAGGTGAITGLFSAPGTTVSGSMAPTTFSGFNTVQVASGASFTLLDSPTVGAGDLLAVNGKLTEGGVISVAGLGSLTTSGTLAGSGALALVGGTATFGAGTSLAIASLTSSGASAANVNTSLAYAGKWTQSAGTLSVATGDVLTLDGAGDSFAGTLATSGEVVVSGVTATVGAAGLGLTGSGVVMLSNSAASQITGATAASTLTNASHLEGAGQLGGGSLNLVNKAGAVIESLDAVPLVINTGANTVTNAGVIESAGTGGMTIAGGVSNSGALIAGAGTLTVQGAVTGSGMGEVENGTLAFKSGFTQNVTFTAGSKGTLALADSQTYTGVIGGLSTTGTNFLDLQDIVFADLLPASSGYSGTTSSGILTVKDSLGHTAAIHLSGAYTASVFTFSKDAGGGTMVTDPPKPPPAAPALIHTAFIQAMAAFAGAGSVHAEPWTRDHHVSPLMLVAPRLSTA